MKRSSLALSALLGLTALVPASARPPIAISHPAPGQRIVFDRRKFMPVSELRPGMRGYALTVFKGTKIEKFGVEILGVMSKFNEGKDYILFRATDGPPVTRNLNIAHGMSGSPIYIKGRLVGAISMEVPSSTNQGPSFPREPIGLATPIEEMLDAWSPDLPKHPSLGATAAESGTGGQASGTSAPNYNFSQIDLPMTVSGMPRGNIARLQAALSPYHIQVMAGAGAGASSVKNNPLAQGAKMTPGSAVGVSLVQGDMDFTATGTVTYRDGDRVLLFGHPFFGLGPIDAALTTAYVVSIYPSFQDSVKLGSPIKTVGRVFQDRPFSVGGQLGQPPQMIPFTISVNDQSIKRQQTFHMRIINHPLLTGPLVTQFAGAAIAQVHGQPGDSVATVSMDANVEELGHVRRTNTFYDAASIDQSATGDLDSLMHLLSSNSFYPLSLRSLSMNVTIQNKHDTAEVDHIFLKQTKYAPGDTVQVGVVLKPYKRGFVTRMVPLTIPKTTPPGVLSLSVKGGGSDSSGISLGGGLILLMPSGPTSPASNVHQLLRQYLEKPRNNDLVTRLVLPTSALNINGEKLSGLPPTFANVMLGTRTSGLKTERDDVKVTQPTGYIISGSQSLSIVVQKKSVTDPVATPVPPETSGAGTSTTEGSGGGMDSGGGGNDASADNRSSSRLGSGSAEFLAQRPVSPAPAVAVPPAPPLPTAGTPAATTSSSAGGSISTSAGNAAPAANTSAPAIKTIGRLASVWRQDTATEFSAGTLKNVSVTSVGDVRLSATLQKRADTGETYLWAILPDGKGGAYAGTGDHGTVFHIDAGGKATKFFQTSELEATSLAQDAQGNVYVGTAPGGIVYKVASDGKGVKFFTAKEKYITALLASGGHLYVATGGGKGNVYRLAFDGTPSAAPLFSSPETNILSLAVDKTGNVYAGASPDGIVYKISPDGSSRVLYDGTEPQISALATDSQGNVYAGTSPKGGITKITPDGYSRLLSDRPTSGVLSLKMDTNDNLYACAGSNISRIGQDETVQTFVAPSEEQFITLGMDASSGQVYAGTSGPGALYAIAAPGSGNVQGQFQSTVHDAGLPAHWGTLTWTGDAPFGTSLTLQTRTGDVETPDSSWSDWSAPSALMRGQKIASPPGRYLQYQAALTGSAQAVAQGLVPKLGAVTVYYLPRNQAPTVRLLSPTGGEALSKTATLRWTAGDPDKDTLSYDLSYSADNGKTWLPLKKKPVTTSAPALANKPVTDSDVADKVRQMQAALDKHPELPPAVRSQIIALEKKPDMIRDAITRQRAAAATTTDTQSTSQTSYTWDTAQVPDGTYQVRVIASDKPSNPQGALTARSISSQFVVANQPPRLLLSPASVAAGGVVTVQGVASAGLAFVHAVQARIDGGDLAAAQPNDGLFDSPREAFTLQTPPLPSGVHTLDVQAIDQAGNSAAHKVTVNVP